MMIDWITSLMSTLGYGGIALLMFLENVFPPIPSELVMPLAGFTTAQGDLSMVGVIVAGTIGSLLGALPWYYAGRIYGIERMRGFADRYGRWLTVSREDIDQSTGWSAHHGRSAVLIGRLVPAVRTLISVPAGVCSMPLPQFLLYSTIGTLVWTAVLTFAGYLLRDQWAVVGDYVGPVSKIVIAALIVWFVVHAVRQWRSRQPAVSESD